MNYQETLQKHEYGLEWEKKKKQEKDKKGKNQTAYWQSSVPETVAHAKHYHVVQVCASWGDVKAPQVVQFMNKRLTVWAVAYSV